MKRISLGQLAAHFKMQDHIFLDDFFVILGADRDCYIKLNGFNQLNDNCIIVANNVNNQWYFKVVAQ